MAVVKKPMRSKALCKVCHDGYADENFSFGRCCGVTMVEIPFSIWEHVKGDKERINRAIKLYGTDLI